MKIIQSPTLRANAWAAISLAALIVYVSANEGAVVYGSSQVNGEAPIQSEVRVLTVTANFADKQSVAPDDQIELRLSVPLKQSEGKPAVFIGQTDLTNLFEITDDRLSYAPKILPLPVGDTELVLYLVSSNDQWKEIARFPLRVSKENRQAASQQQPDNKTTEPEKQDDKHADAKPQDGSQGSSQQQNQATPRKFGFERFALAPSLTVGMKSQPVESHFPASNRPDRSTFTDFTLQGSFKSDVARGVFNSQTEFDIVGSSFQKEALRFNQLGTGAPQIDLSSYLMQFQEGKAKFVAGQISFGTNRFLINHFSSRGLSVSLPLASHFDLSVAAMNGTSIVGFDNFFGLDKRKHRLFTGTLGLEFIRERPGGLRLEGAALDGWLLPVSNFNQGNVNDADRSQGVGVRLLASDKDQRFRLDTGFTRSHFTNPVDPLLNQGTNVVPMSPKTRNARYLDAGYDILKNFALTEKRRATLTFNFRHDRVDPLFRSIAAATQADKEQNQFELVGNVGDITAQFALNRFNDNLAGIPSILKSLTRNEHVGFSGPLGSIFGDAAKPNPWFPRLSYSFDQLHQFAASIPVNGGFQSGSRSVPNQANTNQSLTADWQFQRWRIGYRLNRSFQDNRQIGQPLADLANLVSGFTMGLNASSSLDLGCELNAESADNRATNRIDRTLRVATNVNWRMSQKASLLANLATSLAGDTGQISRNRNTEFDLQWSYRLGIEKSRLQKVQTQFFVRYANRYAIARDTVLRFNNLTKVQTLNTGFNFTFF